MQETRNHESHASQPDGQAGQTDDSSQQQSSGGADASREQDAQETVSRAELDKVIGERQAAKQRARRAEQTVAQIEQQLSAVPSDQELEAYRSWKVRQEQDDDGQAEAQGGSEAAVAEGQPALEHQGEALREENTRLKGQLTDLLRDQALKTAALGAGAINPDQVVALLRRRVRMEVTADGRYVPAFLDENGQPIAEEAESVTDVQTFVDHFLSLSGNANLVRSTVIPGSGAKPAGGAAQQWQSVPSDLAAFNDMPDDARREIARGMSKGQMDQLTGKPPAKEGTYL